MSTKSTEVVQPEGNYYDKYHSTNPIVKWIQGCHQRVVGYSRKGILSDM